MNKLIIRPALPTDAKALAELLKQVGRTHQQGRPDIYCSPLTKHDENSAKNLITNGETSILIAEIDGKPCGEMIYKIIERTNDGFYKQRKWLYIDDLCVDESYRGNGIANAFIAKAEEIAKANSCVSIELNCWAFNKSAQAVYLKNGFLPQKTEYEKIL